MQQLILQTARKIPYWGVIALMVYMPFHVFIAQSASLATGGLEAWKIGKDVFLAVLTVFTICLVLWKKRAGRAFAVLVTVTAVYALLHLVEWWLHPHIYDRSAVIGTIYNVRVLCFAVLGYGAALLTPYKFAFRSITKVVIAVSTVVVLLGLLQYVLPKDILTHFGYSLDRGVRPNFFIDDNPAFPRIMATLRDPNSLAAYLLLPLALLATRLMHIRDYGRRRQILLVGLFAAHAVALYLTFARSAWLGAAVMFGVIVWWQFSSQFVHIFRRWWPVCIVLILLAGAALFTQRHNAALDGILTHSTSAQVGQYDSNEYHWLYVKRGIEGIWHNPLGHGPGTAGLASIQDPHGGLLTENYYVQIGYELGVAGLALFIGVQAWLYMQVMRRRNEWKMPLLAAFWAYVVMNMLLHTWSNEAVAAQWWLVAGIALMQAPAHKAKDHLRSAAAD